MQLVSRTATTSNWEVLASGIIAEKGSYVATVNISDVDGATPISDNRTTISVTDAALADTTPANTIHATEGNAFSSVVLATFSDANPYATLADFTVVTPVTYTGSPSFSTGPTYAIVPLGVFGGVSNWEVVASGTIAETGTYTATVTVNDADGNAVTNVTPTTISVADAALTDTTPVNHTVAAIEGTAFSNVILATFTDANPSAPTTDYSATPVVTFSGSPTFTGTPSYSVQLVGRSATASTWEVVASGTFAEEGAYTATVTVTDVNGNTLSDSNTTVNVADAALTGSAFAAPIPTEGAATPASAVLWHFADANLGGVAGDYTATVIWGDGTSSISGGGVVSIVANSGGFDVVGGHTYLEDATGLTFSIKVVDTVGGSSITKSAFINVADATLTAGTPAQVITATEGASFSGAVLTFTDANASGSIADFTVTVNWGDGTSNSSADHTGSVVVTASAGTYTVTGTHTYGEELSGGAFTVTVADHGGATTFGTGSVNVSDAALSSLVVTSPVGAVEGANDTCSLHGVEEALSQDVPGVEEVRRPTEAA